MSAHGGKKAIIAALLANMGIAISKFVAWLLTASSSMLAESIHSVADSGNQFLLLIGGKQATKEADKKHPFGYGRERYVYAFIVSIVLFSLGGLFALYEAYHKFQHPEPIEGKWWWVPIAVLLVGIVMEGMSFRTAIKESIPLKGKASWMEFIRNAKAPELPVILLEDFAALIGLCLALFGVGMTLLTHNGIWDAIGTACIGVLLVVVAITLAVETKSLLLGEGATEADQEKIEDAIEADGKTSIIHIRTMYLGPDELLVAAKVAVENNETGQDIADEIDAAEKRVREAVPIARVIYLEPDIRHDTNEPNPFAAHTSSADSSAAVENEKAVEKH